MFALATEREGETSDVCSTTFIIKEGKEHSGHSSSSTGHAIGEMDTVTV